MQRLADMGLLALRLVIGISEAWLHGRGKPTNAAAYVFSGRSWDFVKIVTGLGFPLPGAFAVAAALAESVGATLMALGLATRLGAFLVVFTRDRRYFISFTRRAIARTRDAVSRARVGGCFHWRRSLFPRRTSFRPSRPGKGSRSRGSRCRVVDSRIESRASECHALLRSAATRRTRARDSAPTTSDLIVQNEVSARHL